MAHDSEATAPYVDDDEPAPGGQWGRYTVLGRLGAGGMGIVLLAHDPALDRKVALKLLRGGGGHGAQRGDARIELEAQAMARLAHPNVVTVFEIDRIASRRFVAMELVEGVTLRGWLADGPRPWRAIVEMFVAAGRGLAAVHAAGLVHRDFKPDNVLIGGDGRPRVSDFGLVSESVGDAPPTEDAAILATAAPRDDRTTHGGAIGTPAYMSPEQWAGRPVDARSDQFAFCVALWEALWGERPFAGATVHALSVAVRAGVPPTPPAGSRVPRAVVAALRRGLSREPSARWPSLAALLRALERDPRITRLQVAGAAALIALGATAVWAARPGMAAIDRCGGAAARLAGVWDAPRQVAVHAAFAAARTSYAEDSWGRVRGRIDDYVAGWVGMAGEACRATHVEGRQSDTLLDLRMTCLERRRSQLGALTALWARGMDAGAVEHAVDAVRGLPPLAECADARALSERAPPPADPIHAALVAAARPRLDALHALVLARRWADATPVAAAVRAEADATGWPALRAEAALADGDVRSGLEDPSAEPRFLDAVRLAGAAHDDRLAARALINLVSHVAENEQQTDRALALAEIADGAVARAGDDDELRARLLEARGDALLTAGKHDAARAAYLDARAHFARALSADNLDALHITGDLARVAGAAGDYATAIQLLREVLARTITTQGPNHPALATIWNNLGMNSQAAEDYATAADSYRRALALKQRLYGPETAAAALSMNNLALVEVQLGHLEPAQALLEHALAIRERVLGPDHAYVATTLGNLATLRRKHGRFAEALAMLERALAIKRKAYGEDHPATAFSYEMVGLVFAVQAEHPRALAAFQRSVEIRRKALGGSHPLTVESMVSTAEQLAALRRCAEARPMIAATNAVLAKLPDERSEVAFATGVEAMCDFVDGPAAKAVAGFERTLALYQRADNEPVNRGQMRWWLARAQWAAGRHAEAIAAARLAEHELADNADGAHDRAAVHAWLATHRR